ncbi:MAG: chorismate-binding protein [Lutibacter sp.]|uniref:chorismate-binding protein n=1 Tax=Lutibacter sp. TaxID=1925666 RepID=UPI00385D1C0E
MQQDITSFFNEIKQVYDLNLPFVVFRKPNENLVTTYVQKTKEIHYLNSFSEQGFIFAPFNKNEKTVVFSVDKCTLLSSKISKKTLFTASKRSSNFSIGFKNDSKEKHIKLVQKGINFIKNNNVKKVVLSRNEKIKNIDLNVIDIYKRVLNNYKNAFVYLWYHPSVGLWMGATPERLLNITDNTFKTMALAGTQAYKNTTNVNWKTKEQQEQQFVTDFILERIVKNINNIKITEPYTIKAGNLLHIRTDISGTLISDNQLGNLIDSLHPTPAVCGLPKNIATEFILKNEGYNRAYYSGYLGEINKDNTTNLFVNLRCMEIKNSTAIIYVGGGITKDSNAEKEWQETVSKAEVMKSVLKNEKH